MKPAMLRSHSGFTIVEVLIVIVIISILAAIAVPSYRSYVVRTNRTVAKTVLAEVAARQESYYTDHKAYATSLTALGYASNDGYITSEGRITGTAASALYVISLAAPSAVATCGTAALGTRPIHYLAVATPQTAQSDASCGTICLSDTGERGNSAGTAASCWGR